MRIHKYPLRVTDVVRLQMPKGAKPLCAQTQHGEPYLWAAVDADAPNVEHIINIAGTGHERSDISVGQYVGSFQMLEGALVFHVFDGGEPEA